MLKIDATSPESRSAEIGPLGVEGLRALFPSAFREGALDLDVLKHLLGGAVDTREEKFGLNWHGKRQARQLALTPSTGTLRPCLEESVDWATTKNLFIEGDSLEVLKLLQKSYAGKVKVIYIDPPYNTGGDFVYPDDFRDNIGNYLAITGQVDGEARALTSNPQASGRYHTNWLNMIYPRLMLARNLLTENGAIFVSIDDREFAGLRLIMDELFGEENFEGVFNWQTKQAARGVPPANLLIQNHEYVVCYSRAGGLVFRGDDRSEDDFQNPDNDPRGPWRSESMKATGKQDNWFDILEPSTGRAFRGNWAFARTSIERMVAEGLVIFPDRDDGVPRQKKFMNSYLNQTKAIVTSLGWHSTERATAAFVERFGGEKVFDFPKPVELVAYLLRQASSPGDIILDFFAGSGTTAEATLRLNREDAGGRRFILVQLPEATGRTDYPTIPHITRERMRRAAAELGGGGTLFTRDQGFRVFTLDSSNIRAWDPRPVDLDRQLLDAVEHVKPGRSELDVLHELILKFGLDLTVPITTRSFSGRDVYSVGGGVLLVCLAPRIRRGDVERLALDLVAWHKELAPAAATTLVFRDSAFDGDVAKANLTAILDHHGLGAVRSL